MFVYIFLTHVVYFCFILMFCILDVCVLSCSDIGRQSVFRIVTHLVGRATSRTCLLSLFSMLFGLFLIL